MTICVQVDLNPDRIGLTKRVDVGIAGDALQVAEAILAALDAAGTGTPGGAEREALIPPHALGLAAASFSSMDHEDDDPGTTWNERAREAPPRADEPAHGLACDPGGAAEETRSSPPTSATTALSAMPIRASRPGGSILRPGLFGPCGYGFPAIIGAKIGCPDVPVVGFAGEVRSAFR